MVFSATVVRLKDRLSRLSQDTNTVGCRVKTEQSLSLYRLRNQKPQKWAQHLPISAETAEDFSYGVLTCLNCVWFRIFLSQLKPKQKRPTEGQGRPEFSFHRFSGTTCPAFFLCWPFIREIFTVASFLLAFRNMNKNIVFTFLLFNMFFSSTSKFSWIPGTTRRRKWVGLNETEKNIVFKICHSG